MYIMLRSKILKTKYLILLTKQLILVSTTNAKINEVKGEIPSITNLVITTALTTVENKTPKVF